MGSGWEAEGWGGGEGGKIRVIWIKIKPRSHYGGEIKKRSFISTVRPTIHTNPKTALSKTLFKPKENAGFAFKYGHVKTS